MFVLHLATAPRYQRPADGITSYLLASPRTSQAQHLVTTYVVLQPGGRQQRHSHAAEQVYFILAGQGRMTVGDETQTVQAGDCIFIPGGAPHGLVNTGAAALHYFSAAAPPFSAEALRTAWPLPGEADEPPASP